MTLALDRYGFRLSSKASLIADLIGQGLTNEDIIKHKYLRADIHRVRFQMKKKAPAKVVEAPAPVAPALKAGRDKYGLRLNSQMAKVAVMLDAGSDSGEIVRVLKCAKSLIYATKRKMEGVKPQLPVVVQESTPLVPEKKRKTNGHAGVPPKHIEMVIHDGRGNEIPIFASSDAELLNYLLPRVMRKMGLG